MRLMDMDSPIMNFLGKTTDLVWLSILTIVCSLPVITAGAAISSLYYVTMKMSEDKSCYVTREFFRGMKSNFKKGTILWLLLLVCAVVGYFDFLMLNHFEIAGSDLVRGILWIGLAIVLVVFTYAFPLQARYENTLKLTLKNALIIGFMNFPKTVIMVAIHIAVSALIYFLPEFLVLTVLLGISGAAYVDSLILLSVFRKQEENIALANGKSIPNTEQEEER